MRMRTMAAFAAGIMVAAAGTALATSKVAAVIGPDNRINGCYLTSAGLLRVVPAGTPCRDGESAIAWSATGSGAPGPKGDPGVTWRGNWVSGTNYAGGDLVRSGGKVWIRQSGVIACLLDKPCSNTISPAGAAGWSLFAMDGANGARGADGPKGDKGPPGTSGYEIVTRTGTMPGFAFGDAHAPCPAGKKAIGGGIKSLPHVAVISAPGRKGQYLGQVVADGSGWYAAAYNGDAGSRTFSVYAVCADVG